VKAVAVFLSGLAVTLAGAFIRSCQAGVSDALSHSWCGVAPPLGFVTPMHQHCPGCVLIAAGIALAAFSPMLLDWAAPQAIRRRAHK
jgi:hypothetical protein